MKGFLSDGERIASDPSKLLEEQLSFLVREPLQQVLIESGRHSRQRVSEFLSLSCQVKPNETIISPVVDTFDETMLFKSLDDAGHDGSV